MPDGHTIPANFRVTPRAAEQVAEIATREGRPGAGLRLACLTKGWEASDPKAFYKWFRDALTGGEREQVRRLIRYLKAELMLVLGTSSSESALPSLMEKMEKAGCSKSVVGLVVPTGYSFNLDGTNIYMTLAALFIAQATNTELTLGHQVALLLVAMLSSKGAAGVTGAGFITLAATLAVVPEVPVAGMALILGVDRFMSECRSLTNFIGNAVATVVVSRWENALDYERLDAALNGHALPAAAEVAPVVDAEVPVTATARTLA